MSSVLGDEESCNGHHDDHQSSISNNATPKLSHHHPNLESLISHTTYPITLKFMDICYSVKVERKSMDADCSSWIKQMFSTSNNNNNGGQGHLMKKNNNEERNILDGITGMVGPGEILAILGPSGSGKSTLLTALAGRLNGSCFTGTVLANSRRLSKPVISRTGFVTQDDILYPHLTVKETLVFCSLLRLPNTLTKKEKIIVVDSVISELGLVKCANTLIGNSFLRGVSGGEKKRVSIGHEMLVNPSLLLLDEPTSGLDSTAAHRLVQILESLAQKGKTIVTSMHQPSSRVYQMFHSVLVLSEGKCLYFGKGSDAMDYFNSLRFSPSFPMNPADFLLDLANGVYQFDGQSEDDKPDIMQTLVASYNSLLAPRVKEICMVASTTKTTNLLAKRSCREEKKRSISTTSWFNQFTILLQRSLRERRHESFSYLRIFQVIAAALLAGIMWWQSDGQNVQDRLGLLFFITIFWGVLPSANAVFAFPQEQAIFRKERASGMYTLSSYFMARVVGDLPMELILPTVFVTVLYWMAGLKPELGAFMSTLAVLLGYVMVAQGLGLAIGALIMDAKQASTVVTVTMLAFVLTGGFYVHRVPYSLGWIKYLSITYYSYRLLVDIQYDRELECSGNINSYTNEINCKILEGDMQGQLHPMLCIAILLFMFLGYRFLAYAALWRIKAFSGPR